jgi:hypothetical protein
MTFKELLQKYKVEPACASGVGAGWVPLLDRAFVEMQAAGWTPDLVGIGQIKEKFGDLRWYIHPAADCPPDLAGTVQAIVSRAEEESASVCEECGGPGRGCSTGYGWLRTLCEACQALVEARLLR